MTPARAFVITLRKGGVGKTTVALNLALHLRGKGRPVVFLDLDPQRDAYDFLQERAELYPDRPRIAPLATEDPDQVAYAMARAREARADVVVDCPPLDPPQVGRAQALADVLVFPFKAGGNDLRAFSRALSLHQGHFLRRQELDPGPRMFALLNEFMRGQVNDRLLLKWVEGSGVFLFAGCLGRRVEFKDAIAKRLAIWEYAPGSASAREAQAVCTALHRRGR